MALRADAIALLARELRGIDDCARGGLSGVRGARTVAALASDSGLEKGRSLVPVQRRLPMLQTAGVALQAPGRDGTSQKGILMPVVSRWKIPTGAFRIVRDRSFEEESIEVHR
jgi:hypothetical protein